MKHTRNYLFTCLLFVCFLFFNDMQAQFTLKGTVSNTEKEPIAGASIALGNSFIGTSSNADGTFSLTNLEAGEYVVQVRFLGYENYRQTLDIQEDTELAIVLKPSEQWVDTVFVSSTRASEKNTPTSFTNLNKAAVEERNLGQDLPFLLDLTPSTVVTSDAGAGVGYTGIRIRGSDATRVNVTINGIPLNDSESHGTFWVNMPDFASSVENIQIQRGVGTSTNGAGAFGGSLNLQTTTLNAEPYAEINNTYGSFNTRKHNVAFGSGLLGNHFTVDGRLSKIASDGFVDRATSNLNGYFLSAAYYDKKNVLRFNLFSGHEITYQSWNGNPEERVFGTDEDILNFAAENFFDEATTDNLLNSDPRTYNFYTYENEVDNYQQDHYQLLYALQINRLWNVNAALHYTKGRGFFEQFKAGESLEDYGLNNEDIYQISGGDTSLVTETDLIRRKWLDNDFYGITYALNYAGNKLNATLGGAFNNYIGDHFGEIIWAKFAANGNIRHRFYDNTGEKTDFNIFLRSDYTINNKLIVFGDFQFRRIDYKVAGLEEDLGDIDLARDYQFFNPKVGINYVINPKNKLYASFGIGHREPNRANILHNLEEPRSEALRDLEIGYQRKGRAYSFGINGYWMDYTDQLVATGELDDVGAVVQVNVPKSYRLGVEIMNRIKLFEQLEWDLNATFSTNKISEFTQSTSVFTDPFNFGFVSDTTTQYQNTDISFSPSIIAASTLKYKPVKGLSIALLSKYVGSQFLDNTSNPDRKLNAYFVNNIQLNYDFQFGFFKNVGLSLLVNNVFNTKYESNGYTYFILFEENGVPTPRNYNFYYPQAGINFLAGLKVRF